MNKLPLGWIIGGIGLAAAALITVAMYTFIVAPILTDNDKQERRISSKNAELERAKSRKKRWSTEADELRSESARIKKQLQAAKQKQDRNRTANATGPKLPSIDRLDRLINELRGSADAMGMQVHSLVRSEDIRNGRITYATFDLRSEGSFPQLLDWLSSTALRASQHCDARQLTIRRLQPIAAYFATRPNDQPIQLEMKAKLFCAGIADSGSLPNIRYEPYPDDTRWQTLHAAYTAFIARPSSRDPFIPQLHRVSLSAAGTAADEAHDTSVKARTSDRGDGTDVKPHPAVRPNPTTATRDSGLLSAPLARYTVLAIVEREGMRTAIVMMPNGQARPVRLDAHLGNEGGVVADITANTLVVDIPTRAAPVVLRVQ